MGTERNRHGSSGRRLEERRIFRRAPIADRRGLIRRAYFNLIGLPPTPEEVDDICQKPVAERVRRGDRLTCSTLHTTASGGGRHWLDVARYGEDQAHTFKARRYPRGYLYRDWVVQSLNSDMPYDEFVRQQIAGDLLDGPDRTHSHRSAGAVRAGGRFTTPRMSRKPKRRPTNGTIGLTR